MKKLSYALAICAAICTSAPAAAQQYPAFLKKDHERWARVIKAAGVKAE